MKRFGLLLAVFSVVVSAGGAAFVQQVQPKPAALEPDIVYLVTGVRATGLFHRKDCPWLKDAPLHPMVQSEAVKRYFQAHCLCITGKEGLPPCDAPAAPAVTPAPLPQSAAVAAVPAAADVSTQRRKRHR